LLGIIRLMTPRVALVSELYEPSVGGQQTRFHLLATALRDLGCAVEVISVAHDRSLPSVESKGGVVIRRSPALPHYEKPIFRLTFLPHRSILGILRYATFARSVVSHGDFDLVYFNQWPFLTVLFTPRSMRSKAGIDWCEVRKGPAYALPQRILPRLVAFNAGVNPNVADELSRLSKVRFAFLPIAVESQRYSRRPEHERAGFLFLGRLTANKNLALLIAGWKRYRELGGSEPLIIAGTGPFAARLDKLIAGLSPDLRADVQVNGAVSDSEKIRLLSTSKLLVLSSRREGFPNVIAEAMASGTPTVTVSFPQNGAAAIIRKYDVGVVAPPDAEGLGHGLLLALQQWEAYSRAGSTVADDRLSPSRVAHDLLRLAGLSTTE
jgi:glycosyltransferase involved in cell wall biosynthesis